LFERHPAVLEACRRRFRHVLVDEYQDTNAAQFQLLRLLTLEHRNLCVVGDDDQSIYGWRGAEASNLLDLERHYPELRVIKLEQNYRSTNAILNAANAIIRHNPRRRGKQLWSRNGEGAKLRLFTFASDADEAKSLAEELQFQRAVRRVPWGQHAILFRMNAQARPIETALRQAGIAYRLIGGQSFFDRREIKDFLAYLRVLLQPRDDASLLRIANVPARGLSDATLHQLLAASQQRHAPVFEVMRDPAVRGALPARAAEAVGAFVRLIEGQRQALEACAPANLPAWAEALFDGIGYYAELRRAEKESGENRVRNLRELIADLAPAPPDRSALQHLERWVDELLLESDRTESKEAPADAVTLITIHSCKGLEFPLVHIVGVEDGILPHARSKEEGTLDEERRLFYVAMTRAMRGLSLSYCLARKKYGQSMPCHPSPFLKELPAELVETDAERATRKLSVSDGQAMFAHLRAAIG
jgi:superfamily I DNA/RNA helicase